MRDDAGRSLGFITTEDWLKTQLGMSSEEYRMSESYAPPTSLAPGEVLTRENAAHEKRTLLADLEFCERYRRNGGEGPEGQQLLALDRLILGLSQE
jgi:hypothetical protein